MVAFHSIGNRFRPLDIPKEKLRVNFAENAGTEVQENSVKRSSYQLNWAVNPFKAFICTVGGGFRRVCAIGETILAQLLICVCPFSSLSDQSLKRKNHSRILLADFGYGRFLVFLAFMGLIINGVAQLIPGIPGESEDNEPAPVGNTGVIMIDPNSSQQIIEIFEDWDHPIQLTSEGLPLPSGYELWKNKGGPERARALADNIREWEQNELMEAEEFSARTGYPMVWNFGLSSSEDTLPARMVGVEHGELIYLYYFGVADADTVETDELWTLSRQGREGLSKLNLHGEGTQLAMWDLRVQYTHQEFLRALA